MTSPTAFGNGVASSCRQWYQPASTSIACARIKWPIHLARNYKMMLRVCVFGVVVFLLSSGASAAFVVAPQRRLDVTTMPHNHRGFNSNRPHFNQLDVTTPHNCVSFNSRRHFNHANKPTQTFASLTTNTDEEITETNNDDILVELLPVTTKERYKQAWADLLTARSRRAVTEEEEEVRGREDLFFLLLATLPALVAFFLWDDISHSLAVFLDKYGAIGRIVDGGQFTVTLLRPTITGVVVPVISIALATLVSTTVNVLRARQVELRALINKESCELRLLRTAVFGMFGTRQHASRRARALALLCGYVEQLERESSPGAVQALEELQLSGGIAVNELDRLAEMLHGVDGAAASRQGSVGAAEGLILSLNGHRSDRVALVLSVFPVIHWGVLIALSLSVCFAFLLNSNQQVLQYLSSVQLRALFAILVGVFSGTAALCLNLADPFRGSFSITEASTQLADLRICLEKDVVEACAEEGEISSRVVHALLLGSRSAASTNGSDVGSSSEHLPQGLKPSNQLREKLLVENGDKKVVSKKDLPRRRYGLASTVYFHLLTGPLGNNARVLGDIIAWAAAYVARLTRSLSTRLMGRKRG